MKTKNNIKVAVCLAAIACLTGLPIAGWAQIPDPEEPTLGVMADESVLVEEDILMMFPEAPGEHFQRANERFKAGKYGESAEQIRKGTAFVRLQLARAEKPAKRELQGAIKSLDKLAQEVEAGKIKEVSRLEKVFAEAHYALARHHQLKAERYQRQEAKEKVVKAMKAAGTHLENGFKWTGQQLDTGTRAAIRETKELPGEVAGGIGWTTEKIGAGIGKLGSAIGKLGQAIKPSPGA